MTQPASAPHPHHGSIEICTLSTPRIDAVRRAYVDELGYRPVAEGLVSPELAASWGAPAQADRDWCLLAPAATLHQDDPTDPPGSAPNSYLRLVAGDPWPESWNPRTCFGWAALEHTVRSADELHRRLQTSSSFRILAPPRALSGLEVIYPFQVAGPAGEVLYLTEIRGAVDGVDLPRARCEVDRVFIVVLGTPDLERTFREYQDRLGFSPADRYTIPYRMINDAFGFEEDRRHELATTRVGREINVEIDQDPAEAQPRPSHPGQLPPAIAMVSFTVPSLDEIPGPFFSSPRVPVEAPYEGRRAAIFRGTAGELVELIESP